jgi:DNA-binding LacI/PurR family transcriptional regulator
MSTPPGRGAGGPGPRPAANRRSPHRGPTIDDVAEVAGVSRGTVSRVLNGGRYVSPATRAAVEAAMRSTGYVVNQNARSLVTRRSNAFAFVVSEPQERLFEDPNFNVLLRACTHAVAGHDANLVLLLAGTAGFRQRALRYVRAGHVDGVLLVSSHGGDPIFGELYGSGIPTISCGRSLDDRAPLPFVSCDDRGGARQLVQHLRATGRSRIATIAGTLDTAGGIDRLQGYRDVVGEVPGTLVEPAADWTPAAGDTAMRRLLERHPDLDAVFVASDLVATGAIAALQRLGKRVPEDVAVGGFDDSPVAQTIRPALTTVRQRLDVIGARMVRLLLDVLDGKDGRDVIVPTELVVRDSA